MNPQAMELQKDVPKLGCHVNILEVIEKIEKCKKSRGNAHKGKNG